MFCLEFCFDNLSICHIWIIIMFNHIRIMLTHASITKYEENDMPHSQKLFIFFAGQSDSVNIESFIQ